ncbi:hypothetical protein D9M73_192780 [compost metagenome]
MRVQTSAKNSKLCEARGISTLRVWWIGSPVSRVSSSARRGTFFSINSPRLRIRRARSLAGVAAHFGKASLAAATAMAISSAPPLATSAITSVVAGLMVSKTSLLSTSRPLIQCLIMLFRPFVLQQRRTLSR